MGEKYWNKYNIKYQYDHKIEVKLKYNKIRMGPDFMNVSILKLILRLYLIHIQFIFQIYMYLLFIYVLPQIITIQSSTISSFTNNSLHLHPPLLLFTTFSTSSLHLYCNHHSRCLRLHAYPQFLNLSLYIHR